MKCATQAKFHIYAIAGYLKINHSSFNTFNLIGHGKLPLPPMQDYLKGLNEQQREAVLTIEGPLMIVAGAGSGKTKVLTTRIAHLMANGVDAFNILALTFTNKAAAEMKERVEHMLANREARNLYIGTFHSVFARILRGEAHRLGYPHSFTI